MHGAIHHIELYVSNLQKSTAFWAWLLIDKLGYTRFQIWDQGISFRLADTYIVLVQTEQKHLDIPFHRKKTGLNHLSFHCSDCYFVDSLTQELREKGIKILYTDRHPFAGGEGYYAVFFEDPDKIKVEVVADKQRLTDNWRIIL